MNKTIFGLSIAEVLDRVLSAGINMYLEIISDSNGTMTLARLQDSTKEEKSRFYRMAALTTNGDKLRALESLRKMLGYDKPEETKQTIGRD